VQNAPEPSAINWGNVEFTGSQRRRALCLTYTIVLALVLTDACLITFLKSLTRTDHFESHFADDGAQFVIALLISLLIVTINFCIKLVCRVLTAKERWIRADDHDLSMFNKLVVAYLLNNIAVPLIVFSIPMGIHQAWFESGGAVEAAALLMVADASSYLLRVLQIPPILRRLLAPMLARSQSKANQLWAPEPMFVGELYANALKTVTICLIYSPLWPPAYLLAAVGVLVAYLCFSCATSYWWKPPAAIGDELMQRLRTAFAVMMLLRFAVEALSYSLSTSAGRDPAKQAADMAKGGGPHGKDHLHRFALKATTSPLTDGAFPWERVIANCALLLVYACFPVDVFTPFFRRYRNQEVQADMSDVRYEQVHAWLGVQNALNGEADERKTSRTSAAAGAPQAARISAADAAERTSTRVAGPKMQAYFCPALSKARDHSAVELCRSRELERATWALAEHDDRRYMPTPSERRKRRPPPTLNTHVSSDDVQLERIRASAAHSTPWGRRLQNKCPSHGHPSEASQRRRPRPFTPQLESIASRATSTSQHRADKAWAAADVSPDLTQAVGAISCSAESMGTSGGEVAGSPSREGADRLEIAVAAATEHEQVHVEVE